MAFRALLQVDALHPHALVDDEFMFESVSLLDALNLATMRAKRVSFKPVTTNELYLAQRKAKTSTDLKYFCSEHAV